jgi:hypothetical protein
MPKGATDPLWRRWFHGTGRWGIMQRPAEGGRPDGRADRSTILIYVVNDPRLDAEGRGGKEECRDAEGVVQGILY